MAIGCHIMKSETRPLIHICHGCKRRFATRKGFFQHLRANKACAKVRADAILTAVDAVMADGVYKISL